MSDQAYRSRPLATAIAVAIAVIGIESALLGKHVALAQPANLGVPGYHGVVRSFTDPVRLRYRETQSFTTTTTTIVTMPNGDSRAAPETTTTGSILPFGDRLVATYGVDLRGTKGTLRAHIDSTGKVFDIEIEDERFRPILKGFMANALPQFKRAPIEPGDSVYETKQDVGELFGGFAAMFAKDLRPSDISGDYSVTAIGLTRVDGRDGVLAKFAMDMKFRTGGLQVSGVANGYTVYDLRSGLMLVSVQDMRMTIRAKTRTQSLRTQLKLVTRFD